MTSSLDRTGLVPPDRDAAAWPLPPAGERIRWGSEAHRNLFCRTLLDSFDPYRPALIDWPKLDPDAQRRVTSLPIWDIAVQTEGKAGTRMQNYADTVTDPLLKKALDLNAFEERRHKVVLSGLVAAYGIPLEPEPDYKVPKDREWAYMVTGFSECIDSFFAFGLFETARRSGYFPPELVETFEPVVHEEGRHIVFFANWVEWKRAHLNPLQRIVFEMKVWAVWVFLAWERMGIAGGLDEKGEAQKEKVAADANFTVTGASAVGEDLDVAELMDLCLQEDARRLGQYDSRLKRPVFVPTLVRLARRTFLKTPAEKAARKARGRGGAPAAPQPA
jgi:hypothetical protein